jgi:hypothetical protein
VSNGILNALFPRLLAATLVLYVAVTGALGAVSLNFVEEALTTVAGAAGVGGGGGGLGLENTHISIYPLLLFFYLKYFFDYLYVLILNVLLRLTDLLYTK